jgi:toxin ParE1/3/4
MKIGLSRRAEADLGKIADYLRERNPGAAIRVREAIMAALKTLAAFPESGRRQAANGVRKVVVPRYPYIVYYTIDHEYDEIVVVHIRHGARRPAHRNR